LLEGDGHISIPALGNTILNRILNPRIVFTSHINNIQLYAYIQFQLGGVGRFQYNGNYIRYIIGDIKGIELIIKLLHNKFRTPKNLTFNELIKFMNKKYNLSFKESMLDKSKLLNNSWFAGFVEADGNFYIKTMKYKPKSETNTRSVSESISIRFRLDQRLYDKPTCLTMLPIMEEIAKCFLCNLSKYKTNSGEVLSVSITSINKLNVIIEYFDIYNLLGIKYNDFID
jgi:LAGLIDADG endonuclease